MQRKVKDKQLHIETERKQDRRRERSGEKCVKLFKFINTMETENKSIYTS